MQQVSLQGDHLTPRTLMEKVALLKGSNLFINPSEGSELHEKQLIFLVLVGAKPVAEVCSSHMVDVVGGRKATPDDPAEVGAFLGALGLSYELSTFADIATVAIVARTPQLVKQFVNAPDMRTVGMLLGYPQTAVEAFCNGETDLLPNSELDILREKVGFDDVSMSFRLSRDHWQEELELVRLWHRLLEQGGLLDPTDC